jgi:hypothetical protein
MNPLVVPGVDECAVDDVLVGEGLGQLLQLRSIRPGGEVGGHDRRDAQQSGAAGEGDEVAPGLFGLMPSA